MTIKQFSTLERPYEKLLYYGEEALTDAELLAIIIKNGTKNKTAIEISREILTNENKDIGLLILRQYTIEELKKMEGIGNVKAIQIKAINEIARRMNIPRTLPKEKINTPEQLANVFMRDMQGLSHEVIQTAILNTKNIVQKVITNSIGNSNSNSIEIKEILKEPIKLGANKIAIAHNHPSGDVTPSKEDIEFTNKIYRACQLVDIVLLDHLIIR